MTMDSRRSKNSFELKNLSSNEDVKDDPEKQEYNKSLLESSNDTQNEVDEGSGKETVLPEKTRMVTRSRRRTFGKDKDKKDNEDKDNEKKDTEAKSSPKKRGSAIKNDDEDIPSKSPPPKKKKKDDDPDYIELSDEDEKLKQKIYNSRGNMIKVKKLVKGSNEGELKVVTSYEEGNTTDPSKVPLPVQSPDKIPRTYAGPAKRSPTNNPGNSKSGGRKYMILDKATIKEMMDKGLIQSIKKEGDDQSVASYRAVIPKSGPSLLRRVASTLAGRPTTVVLGSKGLSQPVVLTTCAMSSSVLPSKQMSTAVAFSTMSTTFKSVSAGSSMISTPGNPHSANVVTPTSNQTVVSSPLAVTSAIGGIPIGGNAIISPNVVGVTAAITSTTTSIPQVVTAPIYVRPQVTAAMSNKQSNVQVVALPPEILKQLQQIQKNVNNVYSIPVANAPSNLAITSASSTASQQGIPGVNIVANITSISNKPVTTNEVEPAEFSAVEMPIESGGDKESAKKGSEVVKKDEGTYGVPTGVCKVLKSMKMYQYVDENSKAKPTPLFGPNGQVKNTTVRWVAVPNSTAVPVSKVESGPTLKIGPSPAVPVQVSVTEKSTEGTTPQVEMTKSSLRKILKEMKLQHARLIGKHRTRYSRLQKKYIELERDYREVEDVGTPNQIVRDAQEYLSEEHHLFFESQLFLNNTEGKGNRFSKKFMRLMLQLFNKSPAGYNYLKTIFTVPSIKSLQKFDRLNKDLSSPTSSKESRSKYQKGADSISGAADGVTINTEKDLEFPSNNVAVESGMETDRLSMALQSQSEADELIDSKDWFKNATILSESLQQNSGKTVFLSNAAKKSMLQSKFTPINSSLDIEEGEVREEDDEEEEENEDEEDEEEEEQEDESRSSSNFKSDKFALSEVGAITTFDNITKKVVVVPDKENSTKQNLTLHWDENWGSNLIE